MKKFNVFWNVKHSVNVEAENRDEAIEKIQDGRYNEEQESAILTDMPRCSRIAIPRKNEDFDVVE